MIPGQDFVGIGVGALVIKGGRVLLLLRSDKCRNNKGMWTIPGGMVEPFEKAEASLKRELWEETGLYLGSYKFLVVSDRVFDGQHWISLLYLCDIDGEPVNSEPEKHVKMEWHSIDSLPENLTLPSLDAISAYRKQLNK
jgi:ADP-ribose pyrophosphatase YjhB (NUDIX family)